MPDSRRRDGAASLRTGARPARTVPDACPGAWRRHDAADGALARFRPVGGAVTARELRALADAAAAGGVAAGADLAGIAAGPRPDRRRRRRARGDAAARSAGTASLLDAQGRDVPCSVVASPSGLLDDAARDRRRRPARAHRRARPAARRPRRRHRRRRRASTRTSRWSTGRSCSPAPRPTSPATPPPSPSPRSRRSSRSAAAPGAWPRWGPSGSRVRCAHRALRACREHRRSAHMAGGHSREVAPPPRGDRRTDRRGARRPRRRRAPPCASRPGARWCCATSPTPTTPSGALAGLVETGPSPWSTPLGLRRRAALRPLAHRRPRRPRPRRGHGPRRRAPARALGRVLAGCGTPAGPVAVVEGTPDGTYRTIVRAGRVSP